MQNEIDESKWDTKETLREAVRIIQRIMAQQEVDSERVRKVAEAIDRAEARDKGRDKAFTRVWVWFKGSLNHAAKTAEKIIIDE